MTFPSAMKIGQVDGATKTVNGLIKAMDRATWDFSWQFHGEYDIRNMIIYDIYI